jgi:hypothetical protein
MSEAVSAPPAPPNSQDPVEILEYYIGLAKSGELKGIGIAGLVGEAHQEQMTWLVNSGVSARVMIAMLGSMEGRLRQAVDRPDLSDTGNVLAAIDARLNALEGRGQPLQGHTVSVAPPPPARKAPAAKPKAAKPRRR